MMKPRTATVCHGATLPAMWLVCSRRCGGTLFRVLDAEVEVDSSGAYQSHRVVQPGYLCLNCGSPAVDQRTPDHDSQLYTMLRSL